ncbi:MAG: efflux RND transporter periplasmic adaptor subunit, partial [Bacteroidia bacterium]|nr:efflux RND transporter periplasmic adaptor subunit [Bacteroidia bacterium]
MEKIKYFIIGTLLLFSGLVIGWMLKPNEKMDAHSHQNQMVESENEPNDMEIWTCSMHPQIRQNEFGICPICEMDLIPLDNSLSNDDPTILKMSEEAVKLAQIETYTIGEKRQTLEKSEIERKIKVDGTIELDERTIKSQTVHLPGRIESMSVTFEGQYVRKGQVIAKLFSTDLLAASEELLTAVKFNERVDGIKDAAINKLKNWKISDSQIQQIITNNKAIETIDIIADHSGYVISKKLSQGDYAKQGQVLYTVGSTNPLWLIFNVFESDLSGIKRGSKVVFTTPSLLGKEFNAKVTYIEPMLNSQTRTATVRAEIRNDNNLLKPGMLLDGKISTFSEKANDVGNQKITIPNSAILWTGKKSIVYVKIPDVDVPTFKFKEVELGERSGKFSTITSGLKFGDEIVSYGAFVVDAAAQLNNNFSMMNRNVKIKKDGSPDIVPSFVEVVSDTFRNQLSISIDIYLSLKNAFVSSDETKTREQTEMFLESIEKVDMSVLDDEPQEFWSEH